jgi:nitrogen fixation-related uncharacterized protein
MFNLIYGYLIMFKIALVMIIVIVSIFIYCCSSNQYSISNSVLNRLLRVPYDPAIFKENTDCPICQATFQKDDELITLPCDPRHIII